MTEHLEGSAQISKALWYGVTNEFYHNHWTISQAQWYGSDTIPRGTVSMWYGIAGSATEFWRQRKDAESNDIAILNIFGLQTEKNALSKNKYHQKQ